AKGLPQPAARFAADQLAGPEKGDRPGGVLSPGSTSERPSQSGLQATKLVAGTVPPLPLIRVWNSARSESPARAPIHYILPVGGEDPWSLEADRLFAQQEHRLRCLTCEGRVCWERPLPSTPSWVGLHADLVLAASEEAVYAMRRSDGAPAWQWSRLDDNREPL